MHTKYIPNTMDCIIQIITNYEELLLTLREDSKTKKDQKKQQQSRKQTKNS